MVKLSVAVLLPIWWWLQRDDIIGVANKKREAPTDLNQLKNTLHVLASVSCENILRTQIFPVFLSIVFLFAISSWLRGVKLYKNDLLV